MKKFLLLLLLIPVFASAQQTYFSPGIPPGSNPFAPTFRSKSTGTDSLTNLYISIGNKWFQVYSAPQSWAYFSRLFKGDPKDPLNPLTLSIGDSTATEFNNFAVFKNSNGDLVTPSINYSASTSTVTFNPKINANGGIVLNLPIGVGTSFVKVDGSGNGVRDTSHYIALSGLSVSGAPLHYNSGTGVFSIDVANTSQPGYLTSTDWNTFNGKIGLTSISATAPVLYNNSTGVISMPAASSSVNGYLSSGNFNAFSNKAPTSSPTFTGTPLAPTATTGTNTTQIATTAFVNASITAISGFVPYTGATTNVNLGSHSISASTITTTNDAVINGLNIGKGLTSSTGNLEFGDGNLSAITTGSGNTAVGSFMMNVVTTGSNNTGLGWETLGALNTGSGNTVIGTASMTSLHGGGNNTALGNGTALSLSSGSNNVIIGSGSGSSMGATGTGNVFVGYQSGANEGGNNKLYIANSNTATPLIYGDFSADTLRVNGRMSVTVKPLYPNDVVRKRDADSTYAPISGATAYQPIENQRLSTSNSVSFNNVTLIGTAGAGYYDMPSQSTSPASTSGHIRVYSDSVNRFSWKNSTYRRTIQVPYPSDYTIRMPYLVTGTTLEDSTHAAATYLKSSVISGLANPTATISFTAVNGTATTGTRSDGAPKADSTVIRAVANSYSLSGMQTKLNNYLLKTDTTAVLGNVVHKALNETITGTKTFTPAPLFSAMTNHSVLFAGTSGLLSQDNNNFYYNSGLLSIGTGGDFTGTNTVNIYGQYDAYEPQSAIGTVTSATTFPGVTASTSRGTGTSPLVNNTGDLTGGFSGWGYTQASPAYTYMAGMSISMVGGTSSLGGQLDFYTKADGSTTTTSGLTIKNDQTLALPHYTAAGILHNAVTTGAITSSSVSLTADVSGILPIANGGTGSATQNFVDLTTNQTIATGHKTWTQDQNFNGRVLMGASIIPTVSAIDSLGTASFMWAQIYSNTMSTSFFKGIGSGGAFSITTGGTTGDITYSLNSTTTTIAKMFNTTGDIMFQKGGTFADSTAYRLNVSGRMRLSQFTAASTNDSLMAFNPTTHALRMTKLVAGTGVSLAYASGNITVSTANTPILQASADLTAQSAAGNVTTFTVGASTATFNISGYINITAVTIDVIEMQVTYTDENSTSQTANFFTQGATSALLSAIGNSVYPPMVIRAKNGTVITVKTTLTTGTGSITFDAGGRITQM